MRASPVLVAVVSLAICFSALYVVYSALGVPVSENMSLLTSAALAMFLVFWIMDDARRRRQVPCHDFGFLVGVAFPLSVVWYVLWSRGRRGVLMIIGLVALFLAPPLAWAVAWIVLHRAG